MQRAGKTFDPVGTTEGCTADVDGGSLWVLPPLPHRPWIFAAFVLQPALQRKKKQGLFFSLHSIFRDIFINPYNAFFWN